MNQEWYLKEAIRRYPEGTKVHCLKGETNDCRGYNIKGVPSFNSSDEIWFDECGKLKFNFCVYKRGNWAEIISYPEGYKQEINKYYFY